MQESQSSQAPTGESNGNERTSKYLSWTPAMDRVLTSVLVQQHGMGNKANGGGWKSPAYTVVIKGIRDECNVSINKENIKSRLKSWDRYYRDINDMLNQSGFGWDSSRNTICVEDNVWETYVKSHPTTKCYKNKAIENWEDLKVICGQDRAKGNGAQTAEESVIDMTNNEDTIDIDTDDIHISPIINGQLAGNTRSASTGHGAESRKRSKPSELLALAVTQIAKSLDKFMETDESKPSAKMIYDEVTKVAGLSQHERLKAGDLFVSDSRKFEYFMCLPDDMKLEWISMHINPFA